MKVSLHVSVAIAVILGVGLYARLEAQAQNPLPSGTTTEQSVAAPPKADASVRNAPLGTRDVTTNPDGVYATNRKALEQRAGKDAGKLLLRSSPGEALIYIDGTPVGRAPLLLIVPPGKYKVEMRGPREAFAERIVGLLPNETQQVALTLLLRYPAKISVQ